MLTITFRGWESVRAEIVHNRRVYSRLMLLLLLFDDVDDDVVVVIFLL